MHFQIVHGWKITREIRKCFKLYVNENTSYEYLLNAANICWRRRWHPTPGLLPWKSHWQRILVGCSPWSCEESDTTEWLHFHFSLSCIGEGNGNPLQCSCLEKSQGLWSLVGCRLWGCTELDTTDGDLAAAAAAANIRACRKLTLVPTVA